MNERLRKQRVGMFVLMAIVILGILILTNTEQSWLVSQYDVVVRSDSAPSVTVGTPVRKSGILIGRVKSVEADDDDAVVILRLGINDNVNIFKNEKCNIGTESVLGDAMVEFIPLGKAARGVQIPKDGTHVIYKENVDVEKGPMEMAADLGNNINKIVPQLQQTMESIEDAGKTVDAAGKKFDALAETVQKAIKDNEGEFSNLITETQLLAKRGRAAVDRFNDIFEAIDVILRDPEVERRFKDTIAETTKFTSEVRSLVEQTRDTVEKFGKVPASFDRTRQNVELFSDSLKDDGPAILAKVKTSLDSVDTFVEELKGVSALLQRFKDADGTIVKLLEDDDAYEAIMQTINNVKKESHKVGPLMDDARSFADAVARDPGLLGVRGALNRRPEKTGDKGAAGRDGFFR